MTGALLIAVTLLAPARALAFESAPADIGLHHEATVADGAAYDTGYLPSGSPLAVRFSLDADQVGIVDMQATAALTWPEALTLSWQGVPGTGEVSTHAELAAVTSVALDLWGYTGEWELDRRSVGVDSGALFDPLLLPGSTLESVRLENTGAATSAFDLTWEPFTGVSIGVVANLLPTLDTLLTGLSIEQDDGSVIDREGGTALLQVPSDGDIDIISAYTANWTTSLDLVISPTLQVCVDILGCYDVAAFDIPVSLYSTSTMDRFEPVEYHFDLPVFDPPDSRHDFGEVEVGQVVNWELPLSNLGYLELDGDVGVYGDDGFTVYPNEILADGPGTDGVVVTFAPELAGEFTATLTISSSDPQTPLYEVVLSGSAVEPIVESTEVISEPVGGCDCSTSGRARGWGILGLLSALLAWTQSRRTKGGHPA